MNMRERLAKRLFLVDYPKDEWERLDAGRGSYNQDRYRVKADAVLDELMTPTEGVLDAGVVADFGKTLGERVINSYTAMIKAAKEGK